MISSQIVILATLLAISFVSAQDDASSTSVQIPEGKCNPPCHHRHEHCSSCGSQCPRTCANRFRFDYACILSCRENVCECDRGYVRAPNGKCVLPENCPVIRGVQPKCPQCSGDDKDQCQRCGTRCPLTCEQPKSRACTKDCAINVCECKKGFVRAPNGNCVRPNRCPKKGCH